MLWLDDLHWADPGSLDAIAALVRRPPAGAVLLALAAREGRLPQPVATALAAAARQERVTRLALTPLSEAEAARAGRRRRRRRSTRASGGNPFYLEQLARSRGNVSAHPALAPRPPCPRPSRSRSAPSSPSSTPDARRVLDAAAVVGDPFDPALAAEVAELPEAAALAALDDLLARTLVRPASGARRFAFRHPVVRHAVYESAPGGWRLAAHARAAAALERRGAGVVARAHHVEHAAEPGRRGGRRRAGRRPRASSRARRPPRRRASTPPRCDSRRTATRDARSRSPSRRRRARRATPTPRARRCSTRSPRARDPEERQALTVRVANAEFWLGRSEEALQRLHVALRDLPAEPSDDRIRLHLSLGLTVMLACDYDEARAQASDALADARALGDPVLEAAALGLDAFALAAAAPGPAAAAALERATEAFGRLAGRRPDAPAARSVDARAGPRARSGASRRRSSLLRARRADGERHRPRARARAW